MVYVCQILGVPHYLSLPLHHYCQNCADGRMSYDEENHHLDMTVTYHDLRNKKCIGNPNTFPLPLGALIYYTLHECLCVLESSNIDILCFNTYDTYFVFPALEYYVNLFLLLNIYSD